MFQQEAKQKFLSNLSKLQFANMRPEIYSKVISNMFENKRPCLGAFSTEELLLEQQARVKLLNLNLKMLLRSFLTHACIMI